MNPLNETEALSILSATPTLGAIKVRLLVEHYGSAIQALEADPEEIQQFPGFASRITQHWNWWNKRDSWKKNLELADQQNVELIPYTSNRYPKRLREIPDHPVLLYVKGKIKEPDAQCIAIVGTRNASIYGLQMAEKFAEELTSYGFTIVSGLARGVDTSAHQGAIKRGRTLAVIGSGISNLYPRENQQLADKICQNGALISEFPMTTPPDRQNFPQRNRIVSGMTLGTLLVEAPRRSGATITMDRAYSQSRRLFALPGRVDNENFCGNHYYLKTGKAQLVERGSDIAEAFETFLRPEPRGDQKIIPLPPMEKEEAELFHQMPNEEISIEEIVKITKLPVTKINILLMSLILKQVIQEYPGKIYRKKVGA